MKSRSRSISQALLPFTLFFLSVLMVSAEDRDFSRLVKEIESQFLVKRTHIPLFGIVKPVIKVVRPCGAKSLELAIFEDHDFSARADNLAFVKVMERSLSQNWHPLVQVHSRRDGETTLLYARDMGKDFKLMIVTLEQNEAVAIQVKVKPEDLLKFLDEPERMGKVMKAETNEDILDLE